MSCMMYKWTDQSSNQSRVTQSTPSLFPYVLTGFFKFPIVCVNNASLVTSINPSYGAKPSGAYFIVFSVKLFIL